MPHAAQRVLVVPVDEEPHHAPISAGACRSRTVGGALRSGVGHYHSETLAEVFRDALHGLRHHPHRRGQSKRSGGLAGALPEFDRPATPPGVASTPLRHGSDPAVATKKSPGEGGLDRGGLELGPAVTADVTIVPREHVVGAADRAAFHSHILQMYPQSGHFQLRITFSSTSLPTVFPATAPPAAPTRMPRSVPRPGQSRLPTRAPVLAPAVAAT